MASNPDPNTLNILKTNCMEVVADTSFNGSLPDTEDQRNVWAPKVSPMTVLQLATPHKDQRANVGLIAGFIPAEGETNKEGVFYNIRAGNNVATIQAHARDNGTYGYLIDRGAGVVMWFAVRKYPSPSLVCRRELIFSFYIVRGDQADVHNNYEVFPQGAREKLQRTDRSHGPTGLESVRRYGN